MIWCLGMYASGSTWVFNAAMKVAAAVMPSRPPIGRFITGHRELDWLDDPARLPIVKSHDTDESAALELARRAEVVLLSVRDPRDCITSLMLYQNTEFSLALAASEHTARYCARVAHHPRAILLRYETGFIDDVTTLDRIAAALGRRLTEADRSRIFGETRRTAIEAVIATLKTSPTAVHHPASNDIVDMASLWHRHHAGRSGEIGRWRRMLTAPQVATVEQRMQDWMARFGYRAELAPYTLTLGVPMLHDR